MKDTFLEVGTEVFDYLGEVVNDIHFKADEILNLLMMRD